MNDFSTIWNRLKSKSYENTVPVHSHTHVSEAKKCPECNKKMRSKQNVSKGTNSKKKTSAEVGKVDGKVLDHLVNTIEELKNQVRYFEYYFNTEVDSQKCIKSARQFEDINHQIDHEIKSSKLINYANKDTKFIANPLLASNSDSQKKKLESDSSLIKSTLSLTKNTYININPTLDSKHFKVAAQGFIKQAEELKNNISCILDNEQFDTITINDFDNYNGPNLQNDESDNGFEQHIEYLLGSVAGQYDEILKTLESIEQHLKVSAKMDNKKIPKLSLTSTKVSTYVPNNMYKVETFKNGLINNTNCDINLENFKPHKTKKSKNVKTLDPVVLVYEPIKPTNNPQDLCDYCGRGSTSCVFGSCRNHVVHVNFRNAQNVVKSVSGRYVLNSFQRYGTALENLLRIKTQRASVKSECHPRKQDVCCGFMVSYTPNLNFNDTIQISTSKSSFTAISSLKKDYKKPKRRKTNCLWF